MYALGIDLGTTFTAASVWRDGHAEIASLGSRAAAIPSVVLLRDDETFITGESADRRGLSEPHRVAREFKRRLGDTTPILLGGVPYSAEALMARLLRSVLDEVTAREGGPPSAVCICHPANWGPYKTDLLRQAVRLAGLDAGLEHPVRYTTEPEAAAIFYARQQRIDPGAVVAVYDLGGGTFDAAVLRKTADGFTILGQPEGIERLGGIDFDAAVFSHVARALGGRLDELDEDDPAAIAAVARLREECVRAKEALSSDTDVSIPVLLPNLSTEVRLTRSELEAMVRPALHDSIEALKRALRSAGVTADQLQAVLLVGGSSRMPIVAQLVGAELGRPVAVDAHPKHAVALGAALLASGATESVAAPAAEEYPPAVDPFGSAQLFPVVDPLAPPPAVVMPPASETVPAGATVLGAGMPPAGGPPVFGAARPVPPGGTDPRKRTQLLIAVGAGVAVLLATAGIAIAMSGNSGGPPGGNGPTSAAAVTTPALPADEQCTDKIKSNPRWVCLTKATLDGKQIVIDYVSSDTPFDVSGGFHLHIYGTDATGTNPPDRIMGAQSHPAGDWYVEDKNPSVRSVTSTDYKSAIGTGAKKVCARIANSRHELVADSSGAGTFGTGNCVPITVTTG
ncbi:MAG: Hsp70 family protein [Micromonosporaceae bacterium]